MTFLKLRFFPFSSSPAEKKADIKKGKYINFYFHWQLLVKGIKYLKKKGKKTCFFVNSRFSFSSYYFFTFSHFFFLKKKIRRGGDNDGGRKNNKKRQHYFLFHLNKNQFATHWWRCNATAKTSHTNVIIFRVMQLIYTIKGWGRSFYPFNKVISFDTVTVVHKKRDGDCIVWMWTVKSSKQTL